MISSPISVDTSIIKIYVFYEGGVARKVEGNATASKPVSDEFKFSEAEALVSAPKDSSFLVSWRMIHMSAPEKPWRYHLRFEIIRRLMLKNLYQAGGDRLVGPGYYEANEIS
jgi:hypothetical protein